MENSKLIVASSFGIIGKNNKKVFSHVFNEKDLESEKKSLKRGSYVFVQWNHFLNGSDETIILENTDFFVW